MTDIDLDAIEQRANAATPGAWGRYGGAGPDGVVPPMRGVLEAAPGLSIGSIDHTEPIARFSGYLLPVEANADFVSHARTDVPALVAALRESQAEVARLREVVQMAADRELLTSWDFEQKYGKQLHDMDEVAFGHELRAALDHDAAPVVD